MTLKKIILGRSTECDLVLADMTVSRHHAEIELLENNRLLLTDCQSTQGTFVINGGQENRVKQKLITELDTLRFGNITLTVKEILAETGLSLDQTSNNPITLTPYVKHQDTPPKQLILAKKISRIYAVLIDSLIGILTMIPGVVLLKYANENVGIWCLVLSYLALMIAQTYYLVKVGQSLGKKVIGIKIVRTDDEKVPGFAKVIILRSFIPGLIGAIPYAGWVFVLVDYLFIFRDDRRCLHDLLAQTRVVNVSTPRADL